jgi:hypothetical protein
VTILSLSKADLANTTRKEPALAVDKGLLYFQANTTTSLLLMSFGPGMPDVE